MKREKWPKAQSQIQTKDGMITKERVFVKGQLVLKVADYIRRGMQDRPSLHLSGKDPL